MCSADLTSPRGLGASANWSLPDATALRSTVTGLPVADEAALLEAGLSLAPTPRTRLGLAYQGRFASDTRQQGANLTLNLEF